MTESYSPLSSIAKELGVRNEKLYYYFETHPDDAQTYLRAEYVERAGKRVAKYYIRNDFPKHYQTQEETEISETAIRKYERIYYAYVEREEAKLAEAGQSTATDDALWKDMEIVDRNFSKKCLALFREKTGKNPKSYDRKSIADIVYRFIFTKKFYFDICLEALEREMSGGEG